MQTVCWWVDGALNAVESLKYSGITPPSLPLMLSELSVRRSKEMRSNDTLFVSAMLNYQSGSEEGWGGCR